MIQLIESSKTIRAPIARLSPMSRPDLRFSCGRRSTKIEMKTMLSMPSTISSSVKVSRAP